jgi:hypothetical protein
MTELPPILARVKQSILQIIDAGVEPDRAHDLFIGASAEHAATYIAALEEFGHMRRETTEVRMGVPGLMCRAWITQSRYALQRLK